LTYFILNKPYGVLCQFTDSGGRETLANYGDFPKNVYPVGRLDVDSEGLVLLSDDGRLKHLLLDPKYRHPRTYLVQVENIPRQVDLTKLQKGVLIEGRMTLPAGVNLVKEEPLIEPRRVLIRYRKNIPTSWLEITLREGRNRQVRKMTAAIGHPALRLIRTKIGPLTIYGLKPGESRELKPEEIANLKNILFLNH
jgi:23S rRNA pseudouridine2457 synthase